VSPDAECILQITTDRKHMHEFSIADSLFETIIPMVENRHALSAVHLTIGPLAGISRESLEFCFSEIAREKGFDRVRLAIRSTGAVLRCKCSREYEVHRFDETCPECGGFERIILSGKEFTLDYLETED
jgi:hydrogenase nickel incorporation protein HypA/HybF